MWDQILKWALEVPASALAILVVIYSPIIIPLIISKIRKSRSDGKKAEAEGERAQAEGHRAEAEAAKIQEDAKNATISSLSVMLTSLQVSNDSLREEINKQWEVIKQHRKEIDELSNHVIQQDKVISSYRQAVTVLTSAVERLRTEMKMETGQCPEVPELDKVAEILAGSESPPGS